MKLLPILLFTFAGIAQEAKPLPAEDRAAIESLRRQILEAELTIEKLRPRLDKAVKDAMAAHSCIQVTNELLCIPAPKKEEKK